MLLVSLKGHEASAIQIFNISLNPIFIIKKDIFYILKPIIKNI